MDWLPIEGLTVGSPDGGDGRQWSCSFGAGLPPSEIIPVDLVATGDFAVTTLAMLPKQPLRAWQPRRRRHTTLSTADQSVARSVNCAERVIQPN